MSWRWTTQGTPAGVLPVSLVPEVLSGLHDSPVGGHLGVKKMLQKVQRHFYGLDREKMWRSGVLAVPTVVQEYHHLYQGLCCS